jgi:hypothetical protein
MDGPVRRLIESTGKQYTVRNATGGGGREAPSYSDDGTLTGVLEQRSRPTVETDSAGEDVESDLEIRAIVDDNTTITPAGSAGAYPTLLIHPDGHEYRVVDEFPEDSGVTVLSVIRG